MRIYTLLLGIITGFVVLLSACAGPEYTYRPPATAEGRNCAAQCQAGQYSCRNSQSQSASAAQQQCELQAANKFNQCEAAANAEYTSCLRYSNNRTLCFKKMCIKESCYNSVSYGYCDSEYRACYQQCGGEIGIMQ